MTLDPAAIRRQKLAELLRRRADGAAERRLSVGQERILRLARLTPELPLYNVAAGWRINGPLDVPVLIRAAQRIHDRHSILRSTFPETETGPVQRIVPPQTNRHDTLREIDLTADPEAAPAVLAREAACQFDFAEGPLWRLVLLRLGPEQAQMLLVMHHIITDGWSFELFVAELSALYSAFMAGDADPLPPLALQYADYGDRLRHDLDSPEITVQSEAWAARLTGRIPALELPGMGSGDNAADPEGARRAASLPLALDPTLIARLSDLARSEGATLFMVLLAGFVALLARRTGQTDLLLCIPASGRHRALSKGLIGYFNNILPLRIDASGAPTLRALIGRVRVATLAAWRGQDVPFQQLAELPALRRMPLSRLLFSLDMPWPPALALDGVTCTALPTETGTADFDLSVSLWPEGEAVRGTLRHKTARLDAAAADTLIAGYGAVLADMAETPDQPLAASAPPPARATGSDGTDPRNWPRSALEARVSKEWEEAFNIRPIGLYDDLGRLGVSSLAVAELAERLAQSLGSALTVQDLFRAATVEKMAEALKTGGTALPASTLAPIRTEGNRPPLFLCEGVGIYFPLIPYLPEDLPVYGLVNRWPDGMPPVPEVAATYLAAMRELQPKGPYYLGGISYGGLVAFEMAQQLADAGETTALLALFDTPGPEAYRPHAGWRRRLGHVENLLRGGPKYLTLKLRGRRARSAPAATSDVQILANQDQLRSGFGDSAARYGFRPYSGRIDLFALTRRSGFTDSLFDPALGRVDPHLGWAPLARGGITLWPLPGDHIGILKEPHVAVLGALLRQRMGQG